MNLTNSETWLLWRNRRKFTQKRAAAVLGTTTGEYCRRETGKSKVLIPASLDYDPEPFELCLLLRRRKGWTQEKVARKVKVCRNWLNLMERGLKSGERLINFWKKHGLA